jgi:hypothetical protein
MNYYTIVSTTIKNKNITYGKYYTYIKCDDEEHICSNDLPDYFNIET